MSKFTDHIDHGPEVVRQSYHPTLEVVNHVHTPPHPPHLPFASEKSRNNFSVDNHADSISTLELLQDKESREPPGTNRGPFGLSTFAFGILIAMITAIVVGGAVGGGLGAVVAMKNYDLTEANEALIVAQSTIQGLNTSNTTQGVSSTQTSNTTQVSSPTETSTSCTSTNGTDVITKVNLSNYTVEPALNVELLFLDCPNIASDVFTTSKDERFSLFCRHAFMSGTPAREGGVVADMVHIRAYSAEDCMEACSGFNFEQQRWNGTARCRAMTFRANMAAKVNQIGGNCWLKNDTLWDVNTAEIADGVVSGYILV